MDEGACRSCWTCLAVSSRALTFWAGAGALVSSHLLLPAVSFLLARFRPSAREAENGSFGCALYTTQYFHRSTRFPQALYKHLKPFLLGLLRSGVSRVGFEPREGVGGRRFGASGVGAFAGTAEFPSSQHRPLSLLQISAQAGILNLHFKVLLLLFNCFPCPLDPSTEPGR